MELFLNLKKMLNCCSKPFNDFRLAEFQYNPSDTIKITDQEPTCGKCYVNFISAFYLVEYGVENV